MLRITLDVPTGHHTRRQKIHPIMSLIHAPHHRRIRPGPHRTGQRRSKTTETLLPPRQRTTTQRIQRHSRPGPRKRRHTTGPRPRLPHPTLKTTLHLTLSILGQPPHPQERPRPRPRPAPDLRLEPHILQLIQPHRTNPRRQTPPPPDDHGLEIRTGIDNPSDLHILTPPTGPHRAHPDITLSAANRQRLTDKTSPVRAHRQTHRPRRPPPVQNHLIGRLARRHVE